MPEQNYRQFCPVAMASELLCTRWTMILIRELMCGTYRFNELRRGVPRMSPALLSQRLKELEEASIVERLPVAGESGHFAYRLTTAGEELRPLVEGFGRWGQRWVPSHLSLDKLDAQLLMWDLRRNVRPEPVPASQRVVQFHYPDAPKSAQRWWLIVRPDAPIDLCSVDPGFDVDLYVTSDLRTMTAIWMGLDRFAAAIDEGRLVLTGDRDLTEALPRWLLLSPFAGEQRMVA